MGLVHKESFPPQVTNLPRRFGGYLIDMLLPPQASAKTAIEIAVDAENETISHRQHAHYDVNLFHGMKRVTPENTERLIVVKDHFESELTEKNTIHDRFFLFAEPFYAPFVKTLDLGETKLPGSHEEVSALKNEYHQLLQALVDAQLVSGELSRAEAKPAIHISTSSQKEYVTAVRNRDLFSYEDEGRVLSVAKRMTFLMPADALRTLQLSTQTILKQRQIEVIENLIDTKDAENIIPVRTVYYAKSRSLDPSKK